MNRFEALLDSLQRARRCTLGPPATPGFLAAAEARLGATLPTELRELLEITAEIRGEFEFAFDGMVHQRALGRMFQVYDYGNGDGWYLEARGDRCVSWWIGHDPYFVIRLDDSLEAWIRRACEQSKARPLWKPTHVAAPTTVAALLAKEEDPDARAFLDGLDPGGRIVDLRGAPVGAEIEQLGTYARHLDLVALDAPQPDRVEAPHEQVPYIPRLPFDTPRWPHRAVARAGDPEAVRALATELRRNTKPPPARWVASVRALVPACAELDALLELTDRIRTPAAQVELFAWVDDLGLGPMLRFSREQGFAGHWLLEPVGDRARVWFHGRFSLILVAGSLAEFLARCREPGKLHVPVHTAPLDLEAMRDADAAPYTVAFDMADPLASTAIHRPLGWSLRWQGSSIVTCPSGDDPSHFATTPLPALTGVEPLDPDPELARSCFDKLFRARLPPGIGVAELDAWFAEYARFERKLVRRRDGDTLVVQCKRSASAWEVQITGDELTLIERQGIEIGPGLIAARIRYGRQPIDTPMLAELGQLCALGTRLDGPGMSDVAIDAQARRWGVELPVAIRRYLRVAGDPDTPATLPELWIGPSKDPRAPLRLGDTGVLIEPLVDGEHQLWWSTPTGTVRLRQDFAGLLQRIVARAFALRRLEHGERCEVPELVDIEWLEPTA